MSIGYAGLHMLLPALKSLRVDEATRVLLLGTQDLNFTYDQAERFLVRNGVAVRPVPVGSRRTTESFAHVPHGDWWRYRAFVHHETLFGLLGLDPHQVRTLDVDDYEHADILHDLNQPLTVDLGQFDLILDQGTLEHVFDIRQSLWTLSHLTRPGGQIVHMSPAGFLNHGFYNFNPTLFRDYYAQSGWNEEELFFTLTAQGAEQKQESYATIAPDELNVIPEGFFLNIFARFRKLEDARPVRAVQQLYVGLHESWNHQTRGQSTHEAPSDAADEPPSLVRRFGRALNAARARRRLRKLGARIVSVDPS